MRLTTLLTLALIALAPTSAVAAAQAPLPKECISLPKMEKMIEQMKANAQGQAVVVRTRKADEINAIVTEANKANEETKLDPATITEVILVRTDPKSVLVFAQKDRSCKLMGGPTEAVMQLLANAFGEI